MDGPPTRSPCPQSTGLDVVLASSALPKIASFGMLRMVRDVLQITPESGLTNKKNIRKIILNPADPFAKHIHVGFAALLAIDQALPALASNAVLGHFRIPVQYS